MSSAFADSMLVAGLPCPGCGAMNLEVLVAREAVAEEIDLRRTFFTGRIDGLVAEAECKDTLDVAHGGPGEIAICRACEILVRRDDHPPRFEDDSYESFVMERMLRAHIDAYRRKESLYRPLLPPGARVVEIGSYTGGFLHVVREWGWDATGVDIGADTARFSRAHGYRTVPGPLEQSAFAAGSFDGVFVWNCFEQLADPHRFLDEVRRILRPGGILVVRTPNALLYMLYEALLTVRRAQPRPLDDHDPLIIVLGHANLLGFPHLFGYSDASLDRLVSPHELQRQRHAGAAHIDPGIRRLNAAAAREAARVAEATRMMPSWLEAIYRG